MSLESLGLQYLVTFFTHNQIKLISGRTQTKQWHIWNKKQSLISPLPNYTSFMFLPSRQNLWDLCNKVNSICISEGQESKSLVGRKLLYRTNKIYPARPELVTLDPSLKGRMLYRLSYLDRLHIIHPVPVPSLWHIHIECFKYDLNISK